VRNRTDHLLISARHDASRVWRFGALAVACVVVSLCSASSVYATPLASDRPAAGSADSHPLMAAAVPGISVWSFLHPGLADREEPIVETPPVAPRAYVAAEPCWESAPATGVRLDRSLEAGDDIRAGSPASDSPQFAYGSHRSIRHSSGGSRATRTDSDTNAAANSPDSFSSPVPTPRVAVEKHIHAESLTASRLFRPPRTESGCHDSPIVVVVILDRFSI
jgi:hypothetical protein